MKTQRIQTIIEKINYLQDRLLEFEGEDKKAQRKYLLESIDELNIELLQTEIQLHFRTLER